MSDPRTRTYAGIGARRTPPEDLELMHALAGRLARAGWTLRTGGAIGADSAFEEGAIAGRGDWETYRSDGGWSASFSSGFVHLIPRGPTTAAYELAATVHPAWWRCSDMVKALHARNAHEILGADLDDPVSFVVCWTPDGSIDGASRESGGTGQALRIAALYSVPVFNLQRPDHRVRIERYL